ncbi:alanine--tRNA ligase [Candidatus Falkowbacteria bacterium CG11_big_fil_rev_8_21_14_0_20_39_10]|uniref:Alanine--tRNA ligase n=1 Tax=Candidatus Falkowbacteria bacterium CG11_big_fil_rev_8_21_14_0_20_39_10 TaxID=1974570 RepID=A0A2M6K8P3_9BACT|nr:MAG: alanine--tRNA ligase [Candidatus Falkowbacteria bacterium CG11_big_fil_rev_8_21_14_0_20_39_10]
MDSKVIRQKYLDFFKSKGHAIIPSASVIPENDPTTLFTSSGMQPLVPYLMGEKHPAGTRLANSQKSFRCGDIEDVGDNRHNTFFEMLGNWSLGDYFKEEQLNWFWEFLIKELGIKPEKLYVSVYRGNDKIGVAKDSASVEIWKKIFKQAGIEAKDIDMAEKDGLQGGRIFYYPDEKNWWSRSGAPANMPVGEIGGPDSEVFYDLGENLNRHENSQWKDEPCHINCDCGRFIEIGNSVFIEFIKTEKGFENLPQQNVDFGGGFERMAMVCQGKDNIFETDLFINILNKIEMLSGGKKYRDHMKPFEVVADHLKAATFIMGDDKGIVPSNVDQGYVVRRLIRRAIRYGRQLGIEQREGGWTKEIAKIMAHDYGQIYPELARNINFVIEELKKEEEKFSKTLEKGLKIFDERFREIGDYETPPVLNVISGQEAFDLYQTYGFPIEITKELAEEKGLTVDEEGFKKELAKHQELSRTASAGKFKGGLADASEETKKLHTAAHLLLAALRQVLGEHVEQKGSNITAERLRFDFSHPKKMTDEQKAEVERLVNEAIAKDLPVSCREMTLGEAKEINAQGTFESKYGEKVKVYTAGEGDNVFSREICGGPHADRTGVLGKFKITKEESSSAGVRRIKAVLA